MTKGRAIDIIDDARGHLSRVKAAMESRTEAQFQQFFNINGVTTLQEMKNDIQKTREDLKALRLILKKFSDDVKFEFNE